MLRMAG